MPPREAALDAANSVVVTAAAKALADSGASADVIDYVTDCAFAYTAAIQFQDRLRRNVLDALCGEDLDAAVRPAV
ncbi:hypothetical protein ABZ553_25435 [Streptomyces sparsogenes]|uniref:hypothetical protein n=1 Tax=Streptomyces sparsogenes TaxID=67365 RepID=UPI0033D26003